MERRPKKIPSKAWWKRIVNQGGLVDRFAGLPKAKDTLKTVGFIVDQTAPGAFQFLAGEDFRGVAAIS